VTSGGNSFNVFPEIVPTREITTKIERRLFFFSSVAVGLLNGPNAAESIAPTLISHYRIKVGAIDAAEMHQIYLLMMCSCSVMTLIVKHFAEHFLSSVVVAPRFIFAAFSPNIVFKSDIAIFYVVISFVISSIFSQFI